MKLNIAVVDDILCEILKLENFIKNYFRESTHELGLLNSFTSGEELLKDFEPKKFHIVFTDIIMKDVNGIETARLLRADDTELLIIFTTTSREYAFDAFPVHPFDYLLKPYTEDAIYKILDEALRVLSVNEQFAIIRVSRSEYKIPLRLISSVVSQGHLENAREKPQML